MAEAVARGRAMRAYQWLLLLGAGFLLGRMPALLAEGAREERALSAALGPAEPAPLTASSTAPPAAGPDVERIAAEVAARVAADVADRTVARLVAMGWGPRSEGTARILIEHRIPPPARPAEATVRIVQAAPPSAPGVAAGADSAPAAQMPAPSPGATVAAAEAHGLATEGYAALAAGDRRAAAAQLSAALARAPQAPEAAAWRADLAQLQRRWTVSAYSLSRGAGDSDPLAASPVLGAGQAGAAVAYTLDPLARRPVSVVARIVAAAGPDGSLDNETGEAALGVRVKPLPGVPVALDVERRFALGALSRNAWAARLSGGDRAEVRLGGARAELDGYGEGGVVEGRGSLDLYAGGQLRAGVPLFDLGRVRLDAGGGAWAAAQRSGGVTASRFDLGPSVRFAVRPWPFSAQLDWRGRVAGNARPGSGPALTVSGQF